MYFWDIEELKEDILNNRLTEGNKFSYFLMTTILIVSSAHAMNDKFHNAAGSFQSTLVVFDFLFFLVFLYIAHGTNGGDNGKDFLGKFTSVNFVCMVRFIPVTFIKSPLTEIILSVFPTIEKGTISLTLEILFSLGFYWIVCHHLEDLRKDEIEMEKQ